MTSLLILKRKNVRFRHMVNGKYNHDRHRDNTFYGKRGEINVS